MSAILRRSSWQRQPVGVPRLYPRHQDGFLALARGYAQDGLADSSGFGDRGSQGWGNGVPGGRNLHSYFAIDAPDPVTDVDADALNFEGTRNFLTTYDVVGATTGGGGPDQVFLCVVRFAANSGNMVLVGFFSGGGFGLEDYGRGICLSGGVIKACGVSGTNGKVISSGVTPVVGQLYVIACRCSVNGALAINGKIVAIGDISHTWPYQLAVGGAIVNYPSALSYPFNGRLQYAYGANKLWSNSELEQYTVNPWQMFRKRWRRFTKPLPLLPSGPKHRIWRRQPQQAVRASRVPLNRSLRLLVTGADPLRDASGTYALDGSGVTRADSRHGLGFTGATVGPHSAPFAVNTTTARSCLTIAYLQFGALHGLVAQGESGIAGYAFYINGTSLSYVHLGVADHAIDISAELPSAGFYPLLQVADIPNGVYYCYVGKTKFAPVTLSAMAGSSAYGVSVGSTANGTQLVVSGGGNLPLVALWERALDDREAWALLDNAWRLIRRRPLPTVTATGLVTIPPITYAYAYPIADITTASWLNETAGLPLYPSLADGGTGTPNVATYIYSPDNPTTQEFEVKFGLLIADTGTANRKLSYMLQALGQTTSFRMTLMCGATQVAQWTESVAVADGQVLFTKTLSGAEAGTITDNADLRLRGRASA